MNPFPIDGRALIVIALVVVSLILIIFAPQAMANLLGEPFSLIGTGGDNRGLAAKRR